MKIPKITFAHILIIAWVIALVAFLLLAASPAGADTPATATPTPFEIGFGCITGCTPVVVPTHLMPTSAPTPAPMVFYAEHLYLPVVVQ